MVAYPYMEERRGAPPFMTIALTVLALGLVAYFSFLVFRYYRQIKSGDLSTLPQFSGQLSAGGPASGVSGQVSGAPIATDDDPSIGPKDAKLVIVEFLDYQCPFCIANSEVVRTMAAKYRDSVRFIVRDFPVAELHPDAVYAAEAAGCSEVQGKFWAMHDRLFAAKGNLTKPELDRIALESGLDTKAFDACMDKRERLPEVSQDLQSGYDAGVRGTPTYFFNGRKVEGAIPEEVFDKLIQAFL